MTQCILLNADYTYLNVVHWKRAICLQAKGKVDRIERDGSINVPDSEFTINGDEDDPAGPHGSTDAPSESTSNV